MRRTLVVLAAAGVALAARAGEEGRLQSAIAELFDKYQASLIEGEKDEALGALLREVRRAQKSGDWEKIGKLLANYDHTKLKRPDEDETPAEAAEEGPEVKYTKAKERYASGDLAVSAVFYEPAVADSKWPGVVIVHDGTRGMSGYVTALADELAKAGYALYLPYLRGQGDSEGRVEFLGGEIDDVVSAVRVLRSKESVKDGEVSVLGIREGGALALLAANRLGDQIKYAVAISPVTDLVKLLRGSRKWKRDLRRLRLNWSVDDTDELRTRSPVYQVSKIQAKALLMHGKLDKHVPVSQAEGYCAILSHRNKQHELKVYEAAGKDLVQRRRTYVEDLKRFLKKGTTKAPKKKGKAQQKGGQKGGGKPQAPRQRTRREG